MNSIRLRTMENDMYTVQLSSGQPDQYGNQTLFALRSDGSIWLWTQKRIPYGMTNQNSIEESWTRLKDISEPVVVKRDSINANLLDIYYNKDIQEKSE